MASSDDEDEVVLQSVVNYYFEDENDEPISFSVLPVQWTEGESIEGKNERQIYLHGTVDNGHWPIHTQVTAWKFDLLNAIPEISVLTKENSWIKLEKSRKSFEEIIRTVLITVHCLHFARRNPEASRRSVWDHLSRSFGLYEVRPSDNDLVDQMALISEAVKRDDSLAQSKFLFAFLVDKPQKRMLSNEDFQATTMSGFIVNDDSSEDAEEDESNEEDDLFDSVCAFCDNGGELLCCEGRCMRSFHATVEAGKDSLCESLGLTNKQVKQMSNFYCKNCEYKQHQCFFCGKLGPSDEHSGAEVFKCANATCGYFYHPHCVAKLLHPNNEVAAEELQEKIAAGESFACPIHKCYVCQQVENKKEPKLQFAVCRRCPRSYHEKCLPREISFKDIEEEGIITRAWRNLLPNRLLIYCLKHEIDDDIGTPIRDHIKFPATEAKKVKKTSELPASKGRVLSKKRKLNSDDSVSGETVVKEPKELSSAAKKVDITKNSEKLSSGLGSSRKVKANDASRMSLKDCTKSISRKVDKSTTATANKVSLGDQLYTLITKQAEQVNHGKQDKPDNAVDKTAIVRTAAKKLSSELPPLDANARKRLLVIVKEASSSITLEDVKRKHQVPSTHALSSKNVVDKTITLGKVEAAVRAVKAALETLEEEGIEEARAVCEPEVLEQFPKWKNKLKVYLAPFLHGMRYTSFGRHFTKVEKLKEIVDMLHWYVETGDMIVDFCCGANDFSCLMNKKLEETGKKCLYRNYDFIQPKNDFNFEKRDWMTVCPDELPKRGSQLVMGLNPPFGVNAALANKFINKALEFKPKLLILIVPPETERLDKKNPPYDLLWENGQFCSGKSFYLPGSVDENDKQMDQWNVTPPVLYLWSRHDWSAKHRAVAQKHSHVPKHQEGSNLEKGYPETDIPGHSLEDHYSNGDASMLTDDVSMANKDLEEPSRGIVITEGLKESSHHNDGDRESHDSRSSGKNHTKQTSRKRRREMGEKSPEDRQNGGKPPVGNKYRGTPYHSPSNVVNGRSSLEVTPSRSLEIPSHAEFGKNVHQHLDPSISGSHMQYGTTYGRSRAGIRDDLSRRYSVSGDEPYSHGIHRSSSGANLEEQYPRPMRDGVESINYGYHFLGRESDIRSQVRLYGQDPESSVQQNYLFGQDPGSGEMLSSIRYGHLGSVAESSSRMNMSAMQRYAPRLDELNHIRMSNLGPEPLMVNRDGVYDPGAARPGYHVDSMGFAPGPHYSYPHNSAGWLND